MISTTELKYTLLNHGYTNMKAVSTFVNAAAQFNLCVSALTCHLLLNDAKSNFMMQIGKTKLKENIKTLPSAFGRDCSQKGSNPSFQMLASMFPLVDKDFPKKQDHKQNAKEI